jgi:hypothetical protein
MVNLLQKKDVALEKKRSKKKFYIRLNQTQARASIITLTIDLKSLCSIVIQIFYC